MLLYGKEKTDDEIIQFIQDFFSNIRSNKRHRYHIILNLIPSGSFILDYGCGWGIYSIGMCEKGNRVTAIDISQNEIDICRLVWGNRNNLEFRCASPDDFPPNSFDCVLSSQVIEHVHNPGIYLSGINRILKNNGHLVISLPNIMNFRYFIGALTGGIEKKLINHSLKLIEEYDKTHHHIMAWDPWHFTTLCSSVGFQLERYYPIEGMAFPFCFPFRPYIHLNIPRFRNLSYTMVFRFSKKKHITITTKD